MDRTRYVWVFGIMGMIYLFNMQIEVMEVDAAQYASISVEMAQTGSYLEVYYRGEDYLDKPPLLFWLSATSFQLFGVSDFSYKLPSVLVILLGIYALFRFTRMWYGEEKAWVATAILGFSQAFFLITNDVRTDGMLTGWIIFSVWQLSAYIQEGKWHQLLLGSLGVGLAMMTKGPIGLILPGAAIGADLLLKRQWKVIFHPQWLIFLLLVAISLIPMCIGLYYQFDLYPEKEVYGLEGPSGLEFFFWTQSFGRITGDIYWDNGAPSYFFFLTMLWDFQPWVWLFFPAWSIALWQLIKSRFQVETTKEYLSLGGMTLGFLMLSMSNFKLPHYVFPLFPFAAILTANFLVEMKGRLLNRFILGQWIFLQLFAVAVLGYFILAFPPESVWVPIVATGLYAVAWWSFRKEEGYQKLLFPTLAMAAMLNVVMSLSFYPNLLEFQSTNKVGQKVFAANKPIDQFYFYKFYGHALEYYGQRVNKWAEDKHIPSYPVNTWIMTSEEGWQDIQFISKDYRIIETYKDYNVTALKLPFILKNSRDKELKTIYLVEKFR